MHYIIYCHATELFCKQQISRNSNGRKDLCKLPSAYQGPVQDLQQQRDKDQRMCKQNRRYPKTFIYRSQFQDNCQELADKYVELEDVIVFIDLALLQTAAYRHVLFNTDFLVRRRE